MYALVMGLFIETSPSCVSRFESTRSYLEHLPRRFNQVEVEAPISVRVIRRLIFGVIFHQLPTP